MLLEAGSIPNAKDVFGNTPASDATRRGHPNIAAFIGQHFNVSRAQQETKEGPSTADSANPLPSIESKDKTEAESTRSQLADESQRMEQPVE